VASCVQLNAESAYASTARLCVPPQTTWEVLGAFSVIDFAERTGTSAAEYQYTPLGLNVVLVSGQYCVDVSTNKWYCPINRIDAWSTASADTGSKVCPALDSLVATAIVAKQCASGNQTACAVVSSVTNSTGSSSASWGGFVGAPTPAPTTTAFTPAPTDTGGTPAPTPAPSIVKQVITFAHLSSPDVWVGDLKLTYEVGYGITLGIYDTANAVYKAGCSVDSTASAARRAGVAVSYQAEVTHTHSAGAETAAKAAAADPSALVAAIATAHDTLKASGAVTATVAIPSAADVKAEAPKITQKATSTASSSGGMLLLIIIIVVVVVALVGVAAVVAYFLFGQGGSTSDPADGKQGHSKPEVPLEQRAEQPAAKNDTSDATTPGVTPGVTPGDAEAAAAGTITVPTTMPQPPAAEAPVTRMCDLF